MSEDEHMRVWLEQERSGRAADVAWIGLAILVMAVMAAIALSPLAIAVYLWHGC